MEKVCYKNIFYFRHINKIGGIETFFYQIAKKYKAKDITIFYNDGDINQINRLKKYVRVIKYRNQQIECKKAFFNFNLDIIDKIKADEYIQILHGDYKAMGIKPNMHEKITKYVGVSQVVCDSFKEITGKEAELIYNPIEIDKPKKILNLISATRLTKEKGKDRIIKLAKLLDDNNIPYLWTIFTDDRCTIDNPNVVYMKSKLDIADYIANADYLVQLSDNEGYCYSIVEALSVGTPVIVTKMPVMEEIGVVNGKNGFIVNFDMSDIDIDKIYEAKLMFEYKPKSDTWEKMLEKGKSNYEEEMKMKYEVEALDTYKKYNIVDSSLNRIPKIGEKFIISKDRLDTLIGNNIHGLVFVKEIKRIEDSVKQDERTEVEVKEITAEPKKSTRKKKQ